MAFLRMYTTIPSSVSGNAMAWLGRTTLNVLDYNNWFLPFNRNVNIHTNTFASFCQKLQMVNNADAGYILRSNLNHIFIQIFDKNNRWRCIWMQMSSASLPEYILTIIYGHYCLHKTVLSFTQAFNVSIMGKVLANGWLCCVCRIVMVDKKCAHHQQNKTKQIDNGDSNNSNNNTSRYEHSQAHSELFW